MHNAVNAKRNTIGSKLTLTSQDKAQKMYQENKQTLGYFPKLHLNLFVCLFVCVLFIKAGWVFGFLPAM